MNKIAVCKRLQTAIIKIKKGELQWVDIYLKE